MPLRGVTLSERVMDAFADWFASAGGVYQTFFVILAVVVGEHIWPRMDWNGFLLLYWLTVYSAVTQPVLAFSATKSAQSAFRNEVRIIRLERKIDHKIDLLAQHLGVDTSGSDG